MFLTYCYSNLNFRRINNQIKTSNIPHPLLTSVMYNCHDDEYGSSNTSGSPLLKIVRKLDSNSIHFWTI